MALSTKDKRRLKPSSAVTVGGLGGASLAPIVISVLSAAGVPVTPELAAAIAPALAFVLAYFAPGGRKDEPM